jgi:hypothetical protein
MKRLSLLALAFAFLSVVFFILLIFFRVPFPLYELISWQDALDHLTPLVLIPLYWLLFKAGGEGGTSRREEIVFIILAATWVLGHGMHLSANSINNLAEGLAKDGTINILNSSIYDLTYFYDEYLSHYLWHIGVLGLAGLLIYREWRKPAGVTTIWWATIVAGILYGGMLFAIIVEGNTVPIGLPFSALFTLFTLIWGRKKLANQPLLAFFFVSFLIAFIVIAGWGLFWCGFPPILEPVSYC